MRFKAMLLPVMLLTALLSCRAQTTPAESPKQDPPPSDADQAGRRIGSGGVEILSDTQGVDFKPWLLEWNRITEATWQSLIPKEASSPSPQSGKVVIRFRVLPNGRLAEPHGLFLEARSGYTGLDRAAWGALTGSKYPALPSDFHGPDLELRATFLYSPRSPAQ